MIIPVIFSLQPMHSTMMYAWVFCKSVDMAKYYHWPVFSQRQYFENRAQYESFGLLSPQWGDGNDFEPYQFDFNDLILQEIFPDEIIRSFLARFPSQTDAFLASIREPWPEMQQWLVQRVRALEQETGQKAEAFLCLADTRFIRDAAAQLGLPVLHYEWGPFRPPTYRRTGMLDLTADIFTDGGDMQRRYARFREVEAQLPRLTRREILSLFLEREYLHYATDEDLPPEYEVGLALSYNIPHITSAYTNVSAIELMTKAREMFSEEQIVVRYHPGDPAHFRLSGAKELPCGLQEFIRSCKRLVSISSNLDYEAMLYGRPIYDLGSTQYAPFINTALDGLPDRIADDSFLNFIAFGYLVPFEFLKDVEYLRWRLSEPPEEDVYLYHLYYYLNCLSLPRSILDLPEGERLNAIVAMRDRPLRTSMEEAIWMETTELTRMHVREERSRLLRKELEQELAQKTAQLEESQQALAQQQQVLVNTEQALASTEQTLAGTEQALASTEQALASTEQALAGTEQTLADAEQALTSTKEQLTAALTQHSQTVDLLEQRTSQLSRTHTALEQARDELQRIQTSRSWRFMSFFWRLKAKFTRKGS